MQISFRSKNAGNHFFPPCLGIASCAYLYLNGHHPLLIGSFRGYSDFRTNKFGAFLNDANSTKNSYSFRFLRIVIFPIVADVSSLTLLYVHETLFYLASKWEVIPQSKNQQHKALLQRRLFLWEKQDRKKNETRTKEAMLFAPYGRVATKLKSISNKGKKWKKWTEGSRSDSRKILEPYRNIR